MCLVLRLSLCENARDHEVDFLGSSRLNGMIFSLGRIISARFMISACGDKGGGQLIDGVRINTYFGSINHLDIGCR